MEPCACWPVLLSEAREVVRGDDVVMRWKDTEISQVGPLIEFTRAEDYRRKAEHLKRGSK
jgi:hypothetical protein